MLGNGDGVAQVRKRSGHAGEQGFSLIEVLVVLSIMALVLTLVAPRVVGWLGSSQAKTAEMQVKNIAAAIDLFRLEVGRYPTEAEGLQALVAAPAGVAGWRGPYLNSKTLPMDPWGRPYQYRIPPRHGVAFDVISLGADGAPGGEGENADVHN